MLFNNDKAVSPIVATLVLVVVAIAGAAAVGTIMGSFSSDVSGEADVGDAMSASSTELLIAGSTTVQPVSELLAEAYMAEHQGVKVTVQAGGSGAGVASTGMGIVDIGAASRAIKDTELAKYPDLQTHQIGGSAVVFIVNEDVGDINLTQDELAEAYKTGTPTFANDTVGVAISKIFERAEASGTEDTVVDWFEEHDSAFEMYSGLESATGNQGVLDAVASTSGALGFVDFGFADGNSDVKIVGIYETETGLLYGYDAIDSDAIEDELADEDGSAYVTGLTRPLNFITNGEPNSMQKAFITFAQSPGAAEYFEEVGYFPITAFA